MGQTFEKELITVGFEVITSDVLIQLIIIQPLHDNLKDIKESVGVKHRLNVELQNGVNGSGREGERKW